MDANRWFQGIDKFHQRRLAYTYFKKSESDLTSLEKAKIFEKEKENIPSKAKK